MVEEGISVRDPGMSRRLPDSRGGGWRRLQPEKKRRKSLFYFEQQSHRYFIIHLFCFILSVFDVIPSNPLPAPPVATASPIFIFESNVDAQVWDCVGESFYAAQTTARGTSVMFKYACLVEDGRGAMPPIGEGAQPPALYMFSKSAGSLATTM